jgi:hypothetical protein
MSEGSEAAAAAAAGVQPNSDPVVRPTAGVAPNKLPAAGLATDCAAAAAAGITGACPLASGSCGL